PTAAQTWMVTNFSTLTLNDTRQAFVVGGSVKGLNWNNQSVTFTGAGTINFPSPLGCNSTALNTENMLGGVINLQMSPVTGASSYTGGFALANGTLNFASAGSTNAFNGFAAGKNFSISGGILDNTSGAAGVVSLGSGSLVLLNNFTFAGGSSLSFSPNSVVLSNNVVVTNLASTLSVGGMSGGFGLTLTGPGAFAVSGTSTFAGPTIVNAGTLALTGAANIANSAIQFNTNTIFDLSGITRQFNDTNTVSLTNTTLNLLIPINATTNLIVGNLSLGGTSNTINILQVPTLKSYPTTFHLINYSNTLTVTNFVLNFLPALNGITYIAHLDTNNPNLIDLVVTGGPPPARVLVWAGTDTADKGTEAWDIGSSLNWTNAQGAATSYNQVDFVQFDDTTAPHSPTPGQVQLTTTLTPTTLKVTNNSVTYTFTSSSGGYLADPSATILLQLVKQGTGTLIMDNSSPNIYSGGTLISAGTIQLGNNSDGAGNLGLGPIVNNGALLFNSGNNTIPNALSGSGAFYQNGSGTVTLSGPISGAGSFYQAGSGILNVSGANAGFTGTITVTNGVLQAGNASAFGATSGITVDNGAILDLNGQSLGAVQVFAQGNGNIPLGGGQGAIDNSSTTIPPADLGLEFVTLTGDTTFSTSGNRWDLRSPGGDTGVVGNSPGTSTAALSTGGHPYNLTINSFGSASVALLGIVSAWVDPALANIDIRAGKLDYEGNTTGLGNPTNTLTVEANAYLFLYHANNPLNKIIVVTNFATVQNNNGSNNITGPVILTNAGSICEFEVDSGTTLNIRGPITGQGTLETTPASAGTLILNGTNSFTGGIVQSSGTIVLNSDNSLLTNGVMITQGTLLINGILGGGTSNSAPGTLGGSGTNLGPLDVSGTFAPGGVGTPGTFTVGTAASPASLTLESGANLTLDLAQSTTPGGGVSDLIAVHGNLTLNGGSIAINPLGILQTGVPYVIITYSGTLNTVTLPSVSGSANYTFTVNTSVPGQISVVAGGGPPVWNGGAGPNNTAWSQAANWNGVTIGAGSPLYFSGSTSLDNTNDTTTDTQYGDITFVPGAGPFVLNGNNIAVGNGTLINNSSNPQTVDLGVDFNSTFAFYGGSSAAAPLILGGGLNDTGNATTTYFNGYGILSNILTAANIATSGTNALEMTNNGANWTLADNPTSASVTLPWGFEVWGGTFNFGTSNSAPTFVSTPGNALIVGNDTVVGNGAGLVGNLNMVNGSLTLNARLNTGVTASGSTGNVNQTGGTLTINGQFQGANIGGGISSLNLSGGTFKVVGNTTFVASRGAGSFTVGGSAVAALGVLDVSRGIGLPTRGVVNLNPGGLLEVSQISTATANAASPVTGASANFNFNGGTLQAVAASAAFITDSGAGAALAIPLTVTVKSGGAIIDDGGFAINCLEVLQHDATLGSTNDGGLIKLGAGTLTLTDTNTYTGPTVVSNGTLTLGNGSNISKSISISIAPGATLTAGTLTLPSGQTLAGGGNITGALVSSAGSTVTPGYPNVAGTLTASGPITLQGNTYVKLNGPANDEIVSSNFISYGGTLVVSNISASARAAGNTFTLFQAASYSNAFASIQLPALSAGLAWQTNLSVNGTISVVSTTSTPSPTLGNVAQSGGNLVFSGTGGPDNAHFYLLTTTNLALPLSSWTILSTNTFSATGTFTVSTPINPGSQSSFFAVEDAP
ncbi:MAG TPA: autotransporter-associated beta strand repeat-containing protein, partial [Candidatus Saccharimonadales bacterium]|nr:autotransporter-associated beta strand repeat-containing protein [Candidatus Saccharimonadales bacterium]